MHVVLVHNLNSLFDLNEWNSLLYRSYYVSWYYYVEKAFVAWIWSFLVQFCFEPEFRVGCILFLSLPKNPITYVELFIELDQVFDNNFSFWRALLFLFSFGNKSQPNRPFQFYVTCQPNWTDIPAKSKWGRFSWSVWTMALTINFVHRTYIVSDFFFLNLIHRYKCFVLLFTLVFLIDPLLA